MISRVSVALIFLTLSGIYNFQNEEACGNLGKNGEFPWLAAIIYSPKQYPSSYVLRCTGTLISRQHIVTGGYLSTCKDYNMNKKDHCKKLYSAASCLKSLDEEEKDSIVVILGKQSMKFWLRGSQTRGVSKISIHPDYVEPSDADIALITLESPVQYSETLKPICVWNERSEMSIIGQIGILTGWGQQQYGPLETYVARKVDFWIDSLLRCIKQNILLVEFASENTFCAHNATNDGPFYGDGGAGFSLKREDNRYYLRGIISTGAHAEHSYSCINSSLFTDVVKYRDWLERENLDVKELKSPDI